MRLSVSTRSCVYPVKGLPDFRNSVCPQCTSFWAWTVDFFKLSKTPVDYKFCDTTYLVLMKCPCTSLQPELSCAVTGILLLVNKAMRADE